MGYVIFAVLIAGTLVFIAFASWIGSGSFLVTSTGDVPIRYRETITMRVDGEEVVASGVSELTLAVGSVAASGTKVRHIGLAGEAIPIDLKGHGMLFALHIYPYGAEGQSFALPARACGFPSPQRIGEKEALEDWVQDLAAFTGPCVVPPESWPIFVRFADLADPKTIDRVFPSEMQNLYGNSVAIVDVTVEGTDDAMAARLDKFLPWTASGSFSWAPLTIETVEPYAPYNPIQLGRDDFSKGVRE